MKVKEHMSATQLKNIINDRKHLNESKVRYLLIFLEKYLENITPPETFEKSRYIYHTDDAVFYAIAYGRPDPYHRFAFLNDKFIVGVGVGYYHLELDFGGNINKPTEQDQREVINQLFDIVENADIFLLECMTRDNTTIEFVGV